MFTRPRSGLASALARSNSDIYVFPCGFVFGAPCRARQDLVSFLLQVVILLLLVLLELGPGVLVPEHVRWGLRGVDGECFQGEPGEALADLSPC